MLLSPRPVSFVAQLVRDHSLRIVEAASEAIDAGWISLSSDGWIEPLDETPTEARDLDAIPAEVRLAVTGEGWALFAVWTHATDVPEAPAAWRWWTGRDALMASFPSLRGAPSCDGREPAESFAENLAAWALDRGAQAQASAALVIELVAGLDHPEGWPVDRLWGQVRGLRAAWLEWDEEHREAAAAALRAHGRAVPSFEAPSEDEEEAPPPSEDEPPPMPVRPVARGYTCIAAAA